MRNLDSCSGFFGTTLAGARLHRFLEPPGVRDGTTCVLLLLPMWFPVPTTEFPQKRKLWAKVASLWCCFRLLPSKAPILLPALGSRWFLEPPQITTKFATKYQNTCRQYSQACCHIPFANPYKASTSWYHWSPIRQSRSPNRPHRSCSKLSCSSGWGGFGWNCCSQRPISG